MAFASLALMPAKESLSDRVKVIAACLLADVKHSVQNNLRA